MSVRKEIRDGRARVRRHDGEVIQRAETFYVDPEVDPMGGPEPVPFRAAKGFGHPGRHYRRPTHRAADLSAEVIARVDHGRWVAECLTPGCGGAQVVSETDHRFYCHLCHNAPFGGRWVPVLWPQVADRAEVEALLLLRDDPENRNWDPRRETIDMLRVENAGHGYPTKVEG